MAVMYTAAPHTDILVCVTGDTPNCTRSLHRHTGYEMSIPRVSAQLTLTESANMMCGSNGSLSTWVLIHRPLNAFIYYYFMYY